MVRAKQGNTVKIHYTGKFDDGTKFATSIDDDPLQFTIGKGQVISGLEQAVTGMSPGEEKTTYIPAEQAYGSYQAKKVVEVSRDQFPPHVALKIGTILRMRKAGGEKIRRIVTTLSDTKVILDANHPLAGENLTFDLQLIEIV